MTEPRFPRESPLFVGSIQKCFELLEALEDAGVPLSLKQLVDTTGMDKSALQRMAYTLTELGYLAKHPTTKQYRIGVRMLPLSYTFLRTEQSVAFAIPYLRDLSAELSQTVNLSVLDGVNVIYAARFPGPSPISMDVHVGARRPAYCTAMGRAILSSMSAAEVDQVLEASDLRSYTRHTLTKKADIVKAIRQAAKDGVAIASQELLVNDLSIAVPLKLGEDGLRAAVNVSLRLDMVVREQVEQEIVPKVIAAAHSISIYTTEL